MDKNKTVGYHGTTQENAEKILASQDFYESTSDNEWLGSGVYFFAYKKSAEWWVSLHRFDGHNTSILCADLEYDDEQFLNLDDPAQFEYFKDVVEYIVKNAKEKGTPLDVDFTHLPDSRQWCFACNLMREFCPGIGMISYTFPKQGRPDQYTGFRVNHRQICVTDHSIITCVKECEDVSC